MNNNKMIKIKKVLKPKKSLNGIMNIQNCKI